MNKFANYFLMLIAMVGLGFLTSCGDDDGTVTPGAPSIVITTDDGENEDEFNGYVGDSVVLNISIDAPSGFNTLRIYRQVDGVKGSAIATYSKVSGTTVNSFDTTYTYTIREDDVDDAVFLIFEAVDDSEGGIPSTLEYEVIAEDRPTIRYEMKLLYAPNSNLASKTFFSTNDGMTYSVNDVLGTDESVSPKIDFGYFYGSDFKATLASPAAYPIDYTSNGWEARNETKIKRTDLSAAAFIELENDREGINNAFEQASYGANEGQVRNLLEGEILAFELVTSKGNNRGLIQIKDIVGTMGTNDYIEIDVIVVD